MLAAAKLSILDWRAAGSVPPLQLLYLLALALGRRTVGLRNRLRQVVRRLRLRYNLRAVCLNQLTIIRRSCLFYLHQDALAFLGNQTSHYLLRHVLGRVVEELFELHGGEALDDLVLAADGLRELRLELIGPAVLLERVADQPPPSVSHLVQAIGQPLMHLVAAGIGLLAVGVLVRHVPDIVRDEALHELLLVGTDQAFLDRGHFVREARHVLYQDIVARDHDFGLLLAGLLRRLAMLGLKVPCG